jgi:hypothetical protein
MIPHKDQECHTGQVNHIGQIPYQPLKKVRVTYLPFKILKFFINPHSYLLFLNRHRHPPHDLTVLNRRGKYPFTPGCFRNGVMFSILCWRHSQSCFSEAPCMRMHY